MDKIARTGELTASPFKIKLKQVAESVFFAIIVWSGHIIVIISLLTGFWLLHRFVIYLWGSDTYTFFGLISVKLIFDAADIAILVGLLVYGSIHVIKAYRNG